ncbi:hypothetical protein PG988_008536 [Apiospora saccharicola]
MPNTATNCNKSWTVEKDSGDTCCSITQKFGITLDQFYTWNPDVTDNCGTNFWVGESYRVGIDPNKPTTTPSRASSSVASTTSMKNSSRSTSESSPVTTSVPPNTEPYTTNWPITNWTITPTTIESSFPPQRTQPGQPPRCNNWYLVEPTDTCKMILSTNSWLTLEKLRTTTDGPANVPTFAGNYTFTTLPEVNSTLVAEPTQTGIISGCLSYYQAQEGETCRSIVDGHYLTEEDFLVMNPALDGKRDGLWKGYYYCDVGPSGITVMPPTATSRPAAVPSGQDSHCQHWYQRDGESCADIVTMFGAFSLSDFLSWNPSLGGQSCGGIVDGTWHCVGVPGTPTTRTEPLPGATQPPTPT